jgi:hypothetical protein
MQGKKSDFAYMAEDASRITIGYGLQQVGKTEVYEWWQICFYKKQTPLLSLQMVKDAILADINSRTDEKILSGYEWTVLHGDDAGKTVKVWLSAENKENYKAKFDMAHDDPELVTWPAQFKVSENDDKTPVYEFFEDITELKAFYYGGLNYIEQTVNAGWAEKDGMDWSPYEALFPAANAQEQSNASSE